MDSAYDHIQEESYPQDPPTQQAGGESTQQQPTSNFNTEVQDAYKAISSSPWAARLGGFLGTVKKQGEQYYDTASKQYAPLTKNATAGVSNLISHARKLSVQPGGPSSQNTESTDKDASTAEKAKESADAHPDRPESLPADIVREAEGILSRFRSEATKRLKDIEKAEDAADEALLKFGSNIRNFLRDAVTIAPPESGSEADKNGDVLFESKDSSGKKVVHATRFDAQLHVIHSTLASFLKDPASPEWENWKSGFDVEKKTEAIAKDLDKHEELRSAMEKCVPEKVDYATFWCRYYFLRHVIESEEQRRREMLKASAPVEEEVAWDEDSDEEVEEKSDKVSAAQPEKISEAQSAKPSVAPPATPSVAQSAPPSVAQPAKPSEAQPTKPSEKKRVEESDEDSDEESDEESDEDSEEDSDEDSDDESSTPARTTSTNPNQPTNKSATSLAASVKTLKPGADDLKPAQPRRSHDEKSVADSDASYDVVSGTTSRASPPQARKGVAEESDEEDWE